MTKAKSLAARIKKAPAVIEPEAAQILRDCLGKDADSFPANVKALLDGVAGCSPYLRRLMQGAPDLLLSVLDKAPEESLKSAIDLALLVSEEDATDTMAQLRRAKAQAALTIALADIAGVWTIEEATQALSDFADAAVEGALNAAVKSSPLESSAGISVIAMGKHGAGELNYSSDIDLIIIFDADLMNAGPYVEAQSIAVKLTKSLVNFLQTQTADGYVFRTDLRLRPDPGVTAAAISASAAETYYEAYGQNWERMAFIKARACAGDKTLGDAFLAALRPFVWRKYLDFAAIEDVHAVKRQIHTAKGGSDIEFEGHDIKLGRGGIREIEFYVQTQQLILGGKNSALRMRGTLDALKGLCQFGHITEQARDDLTNAYRYFRHVEHRLQMINDEQTHRIPKSEEDIERLAVFSDEKDRAALKTELLDRFSTVQQCYAALFEYGDDPQFDIGPLVFTGVEDHPDTLETLEGLGFSRGPEISAAIRRWHTGAMRATRTERARELLTKLIPPLLEALSKANNPDDAFFAFEGFLTRLPSGVQIFSLLLNNLEVFDALIQIMTISPYLGRELSKRFNFIEQLIDNEWASPPPDPGSYAASCKKTVEEAPTYEQALNAVRRWAGEHRFQIAAQLAVGVLAPDEGARYLAAIADACILALAPAAMEEMATQHGTINGELAVIGLGRLGSEEMTVTSDVDLMFVYDAPPTAMSDGKRPLGAVDYFTRLVRRIVTALSAATEEGALYDVDMQLRPSGGAGPTAVSFSALRKYYQEDAWTWEFMALSRARLVTPRSSLGDSVMDEIAKILQRPRSPEETAIDVADMRDRLEKAKPAVNLYDVKHIRGGQTDIAFICQYLALTTAAKMGRPPSHIGRALAWFTERGEISEEAAVKLVKAHSIYEALLQVSRAATGGVFAPDTAGAALTGRIAAICGGKTIGEAEQILTKIQRDIGQIFDLFMARAAGARGSDSRGK